MTATSTFGAALGRYDIDCPDMLADIEVPVLSGPQRQGDVLMVPCDPRPGAQGVPVGRDGIRVVRGEATGNSHILDAPDGGVEWIEARIGGGSVVLGWVYATRPALLVHTDEHGVNAMAPGWWELRGKREQRDEIERVAD